MDTDALADVKVDEVLTTDESFFDTLNDDEENDTPAESPTENNEDGTNPSQEGEEEKKEESTEETTSEESAETTEDSTDNTPDVKPEPFHKHPRWQAMQEKNQTLLDEVERLSTTVEGIQNTPDTNQVVEMPLWFQQLAGNDEQAKVIYQGYQQQTKSDREVMRKEIIAEQAQQVVQTQKETSKWDSWVSNELDRLEDTGEVFDRNELTNVAVKYQPTDETGNISLEKSLEILKMQKAQTAAGKKESVTARKKIASSTTSDNKGEQTPTTTIDSGSLRGKTFAALVNPND